MFILARVRITEILIIEVFCYELFGGPENFVRISKVRAARVLPDISYRGLEITSMTSVKGIQRGLIRTC